MRSLFLIAIAAGVPSYGIVAQSSAPSDADSCSPVEGISFICGQSAAEDLLAVPGTPWVVVSSFTGSGGLRVIDARDKSIVTVYPSASAADRLDKKKYGACPGAPVGADRDKFHTHGISVARGKNGRHTVLAVHHGARESVEVFSLDVRGNTPVASWIGCVVAPDIVSLNSVVALPDGGFIATSFSKRVAGGGGPPDARLRSGENSGELWEWHPGKEWVKVPGSESSGPNGLEISKDGKTLYIGAWGSQSMVRISRGSAVVKRDEVPLGFRVDNLHWTADGMLIAAGQTESPRPGSKVVEIDPKSLKVTEIIDRANSKDFGFGTAALRVGKETWVGSFRSNRVAVFPAAAPLRLAP